MKLYTNMYLRILITQQWQLTKALIKWCRTIFDTNWSLFIQFSYFIVGCNLNRDKFKKLIKYIKFSHSVYFYNYCVGKELTASCDDSDNREEEIVIHYKDTLHWIDWRNNWNSMMVQARRPLKYYTPATSRYRCQWTNVTTWEVNPLQDVSGITMGLNDPRHSGLFGRTIFSKVDIMVHRRLLRL